MARILKLAAFEEVYWSLDGSERAWIDKVYAQLCLSLSGGKPLRFEWFREKKWGTKRLYFVVDESKQVAVFIAWGDKKDQDALIKKILENKDFYLSLLR